MNNSVIYAWAGVVDIPPFAFVSLYWKRPRRIEVAGDSQAKLSSLNLVTKENCTLILQAVVITYSIQAVMVFIIKIIIRVTRCVSSLCSLLETRSG